MHNLISPPRLKKRVFTVLWLIACSLFVAPLTALAKERATEWVLSYQGQSTNAFIWDKRAHSFIKNSVPAKMAADLLSALGGPPDPVLVVDHRYVRVSACVPHACMDKGFFWIDTLNDIELGAYLSEDKLVLGSSRLSSDELPVEARQSLIAWLSDVDIQPHTVQFVARDGRVTDINPEQFLPKQKFRPSPEGPSFDCKKASTNIETAICSHPALAKQDLDVASLYIDIRRGSGTVGAQNQLDVLQRTWIKSRNAACETAPALVECIGDQYRRQHDRLMNWVPTR